MNSGTPHSGRLGPSLNRLKRARTPNLHDDVSVAGESTTEKDPNPIQERREKHMRDLLARSNRLVRRLFDGSLEKASQDRLHSNNTTVSDTLASPAHPPSAPQPQRRAARQIDEEDYGEEDEDEDTSHNLPSVPALANSHDESRKGTDKVDFILAHKPSLERESAQPPKDHPRSAEDARKRLEEEKRAAETAAKESFLTRIYTLENDRDAMLEQQKLDELDRQVETEMSGSSGNQDSSAQAQGTLSSANLGASSLALKHLIAQIDKKRDHVPASDAEIQHLVSAVRKNRSKWASEDRVGQEELYEAAERVLMDLKGQTEYSTPFLQRVKQREVPDYYKIITKPMDIGTMLKKLKNLEYKSKTDFTDDLNLIWENCLKYNQDKNHPLQKKANHMMSETARLTPLIPDIVVRDRAEIEAEEQREERRRHFATLDDSDEDDQPIVATRGRKAPSKKGVKGASSARKAPPASAQTGQDSPVPESKPPGSSQAPTSSALNVKNDLLRSDVDSIMGGSQNGISTPPVGTHTPLGASSFLDGIAAASHADASEIDGANASLNGVGTGENVDDGGDGDEEYRIWKQVTKKDRARMAAERHKLFRSDRINPDEPALLRSRAGMRRWIRQQRTLLGDDAVSDLIATQEPKDGSDPTSTQTLAEGIDGEDEDTLPDYYYPLAGMPAVPERLKWTEDSEGFVIDRREDCLRVVPRGQFTATESQLTAKIDLNLRQMQETRKLMAKIGMVKQMQLQTQTYQNQFQKYEPEPFQEADTEPMIVSDDGPPMPPAVSRAALQRSIAKICYHAGFEDYQPSALDTLTDVVTDWLQRQTTTLLAYHEHTKVNPSIPESYIDPVVTTSTTAASPVPVVNSWQPRFTTEEATLHTLQRNGYDLESLTSYIEDDIPRLGQKLNSHLDATKQHYTDLLRPVIDPAQVAKDGGASAFNDGNETQFLAGDFAEDIDEDFFGFKELGLDKEFNMSHLSVPFHLLQSRYNNRQQVVAGSGAGTSTENTMEDPPRWAPVTEENIKDEIGLVHDFFKEKLEKTNGGPLVEDEDLPAKQRFPKPRLPPTGKISSPRKRPIREQQMMARKKRRLEIEAERARERQEQEGNSSMPNANMDGSGGGTIAVANTGATENADISGAATAEGTVADSEDSSRRPSVVQTTSNGNLPNGVLTNGDTGHDPETPVEAASKKPLPKPVDKLKLDKPKENQAPDTDPEKTDQPTESSNHDTMHNGDKDQDGEGGLISPESVPIAAH